MCGIKEDKSGLEMWTGLEWQQEMENQSTTQATFQKLPWELEALTSEHSHSHSTAESSYCSRVKEAE